MLLKDAINLIPGLRSVITDLDIRFTGARRMLYEQVMCTDRVGVEKLLARVATVYDFYTAPEGRGFTERIKIRMGELRDIPETLARLDKGAVIGDIEFFEIKMFAMLSGEIREMAAAIPADVIDIPDLSRVLSILDPQGSGSARFAVYDHFMPELACVRAKIKELGRGPATPELERLKAENTRLEDRVREELSGKLRPIVPELGKALKELSLLDILLAQAMQAVAVNFCRPVTGEGEYRIAGLFNPEVAAELAARGRSFQDIDITFGPYPTLITGANMAGKSVILKSVALAQVMMQFGFYVPARSASLPVMDEVVLISGDMQCERSGLSSFASEIKQLTRVTDEVRQGCNILFLYDEPARTTNPAEGQALVNAIVRFLSEKKVYSLITTHYSGIEAPRRLRVRGLENCKGTFTDPGELHQAMDYRLREEVTDEVPNEAFRIARAFGADGEILSYAERLVEKGNRE